MQRTRKCWNAFQNIEIAIAVLAAIAVILPMCFGIMPFGVMSGSMEPKIKTGSVCYVNTRAENFHTGDVITFKTGGKTVTHRIIGKSGNTLMTKGDANRVSDPWTVNQSQIIGKTMTSVPYAGYIVKTLQTRKGIMAMISVISANALVSLLLKEDNRKTAKREQQKQ
jgi:signal peptidase